MSHLKHVMDYLDQKGAEYELLHHSPAFTAQRTAEAQHVPGKNFIKAVIIKSREGHLMCVLPAIHHVNFEKLQAITGIEGLKMASEEEIEALFPQCDVGAEPPFGSWAGIPVYMDQALLEDEYIVFNAGTHTETVKMSLDDYQRIENPAIVPLGVHIAVAE
ncbi:MAG: YbaK/EbsC family protein [Verrucomicrobia bacterium]|nr:YbaK/EbsC family protein [Verrucomicrobiota bacterium]